MITLGANTVGIGLVLRLRDQFTANAQRINNQFTKLYGNAARAHKQNLVAARQVAFVMGLVGFGAVRAFGNAVDTAAEFNYTLKGVQAVTRATAKDMKLLHDQAIAVGMTSKFTAKEVASAAEYLAKAGFEMPDIRKALPGVANLGAAADVAIGGKEGAAGILANILNTFGLRAEATGRVSDIMSRAAVKSSVDLLDLAESIKYAGSVATTLKLPFEDVNAMLAVMGNRGMRGSMAGVGLSNMLMYLSKAVGAFRTKRQSSALKMIGIDPQELIDAQGNLLPMIKILDIFRAKMGKMATTQQVSILEGLMNIRGARAFVPLFQDTEIGMSFSEMLKDLQTNATGAAEQMSKMRMDTLKGDMMILSDTWDAFKISIGETLEPIVRFGAKFATKVLGGIIKFASTPFGKTLVVIAAGLSLVVAIGGSLLVAFTSIKLLTIASTVSFANMGRSLAWAWNSGTAAALRYMTTARAATLSSVGGKGMRWRDAAGRFTKAPVGGAAGGSMITRMLGGLGRVGSYATTILGRFGSVLKLVTGTVGLFVTAMVMMVGFKNIIKGVVWGLGFLMHTIIWAAKTIWAGITLDWGSFGRIGEEYSQGLSNMSKGLGFEAMPIEKIGRKDYKESPYENTIGLRERMEALSKERKIKPTAVNMDGKKVGAVIWEEEKNSLAKLLEYKN